MPHLSHKYLGTRGAHGSLSSLNMYLHVTHPTQLECATPPFSAHGTDVVCLQPWSELTTKCAIVFHFCSAHTFLTYRAYALYAPLYITRPILTCNYFMWHVCTALRSSVLLQLSRPKTLSNRYSPGFISHFSRWKYHASRGDQGRASVKRYPPKKAPMSFAHGCCCFRGVPIGTHS